MKRRFISIYIFCVLLLLSMVGLNGQAMGAEQLSAVKIGFVTDGPLPAFPEMVDLFQTEIEQMVDGEFVATFPETMRLEADMTQQGVNAQLDNLLSNPQCDLIVMLGIVGSTEALKRKRFTKPVIAPLVYGARLQQAPSQGVGSGVANLYYIDLGEPLEKSLVSFRKLVPFSHLTLLLDRRDVEGVPVLKDLANSLSQAYSLKIEIVPVGDSVGEVLSQISQESEAVMVGPLWQFSIAETEELSQLLVERKLPSMSFAVSEYLESGMFATTQPPQAEGHIARQVAINVQEILLGDEPGKLPVAFSGRSKLSINMATAKEINILPNIEYMTGTRLINNERSNITRKLSLFQVVGEALDKNLDLAVAERKVAAGKYRVKESRSPLLPQISVSLEGRAIDDDRAQYSGGTAPERALTGSVTASQLLYSEQTWANYAVEQHTQKGREFLRDSVRLDIIYQVATAYLDVLRNRTIEQVQRDNMQLTQANLERAQIRLSTGVAGPDELYRWQTQFAGDRQAVLKAESGTLNAMQLLNRLINRPQTEEFATVETDMKDPLFIGGNEGFYNLFHDLSNFQKFQKFAIVEAQKVSPELKAISAEIAAQERLLVGARRDFWAPTVSMEARFNELLNEGGEGQRDRLANDLDDTEWQVGVVVSFPLYEGGRKNAAVSRNQEELMRLKTLRRTREEQITQQILVALNSTRASYPSINISRDAVDAARNNLQLVSDSYIEGIKSIIDLVDAQNQALQAELDSANAVYDFLTDLMGLERSMGTFYSFLPATERNKWMDKFKAYADA